VSHASRDANLFGAAALAVADRLTAAPRDAALLALDDWLAGATVDALARVVGLTHSGAVRLADRLEGEGLLQRRPGADGRSVALHLTPAGGAEAAGLRAAREATLSELLAPVADRRAFVAGLEAVLAAVTTAGAAPGRTCRICDAHACGHPDRCPVTRAAHH
jgi:MarR family transcriptional regulator, negative regulator of the multidrug operon emrRAB